ncbi:MAG: hypothetical protein N3A60_04805, partial [Thermanaerothrix sp.]|nr:hypothetical protein [Thermanaerothrix sp.]
AARALELDFIPLFQEAYDLIIPCKFAEEERIRAIFDLMGDSRFRHAVSQLPGYDVGQMGVIVQAC